MPSLENSQPETQSDDAKRIGRIRALNDHLRHTMRGGRVVMTAGIRDLPTDDFVETIKRVTDFVDFSEDNDPHGEHDFGAFDVSGQKIFWKIDYYDADCCMGSPDPADQKVTTRVLTILLASEY